MLVPGDAIRSATHVYKVTALLGEGNQGAVFEAHDGTAVRWALKWYHESYIDCDRTLRHRIEHLVQEGPPNDRFLWPVDIIEKPGQASFGYAMALREPRFRGLTDLMSARCEPPPTFRAILTASIELTHCFLMLHAMGLCYRDISFGNCFFDPATGEVRICDNDNVDVNGTSSVVMGTTGFIAPELVTGEHRSPDVESDLFSLAVLLFYLQMVAHPLEGARESGIRCFDEAAKRHIYGTHPLFIFDPNDDSNRPVRGIHDNAFAFWPLYPQVLRDAFEQAFVRGLVPSYAALDTPGARAAGVATSRASRVREGEWRDILLATRDAIFPCASCGAENFYDASRLRVGGGPGDCWSCARTLALPARLRIQGQNQERLVMMVPGARLYGHHLDPLRAFRLEAPAAEVTRHPSDPTRIGLTNLSPDEWVYRNPDGKAQSVARGRSCALANGARISFGKMIGEVRL
ncbi:MAG: serine/threonine-protein kinase [Polyangiaceae bacterium]